MQSLTIFGTAAITRFASSKQQLNNIINRGTLFVLFILQTKWYRVPSLNHNTKPSISLTLQRHRDWKSYDSSEELTTINIDCSFIQAYQIHFHVGILLSVATNWRTWIKWDKDSVQICCGDFFINGPINNVFRCTWQKKTQMSQFIYPTTNYIIVFQLDWNTCDRTTCNANESHFPCSCFETK